MSSLWSNFLFKNVLRASALSLLYICQNALIRFYPTLTQNPSKSALAMGSKSLWGRERPSICSPSSLLLPIKPLQGSARRPSGGSRRLTKGGERTDHLPICNQTKLYLKNGIEIDRHKSHLYQSTLIDETATKVYPLSPSSLKSQEKIHTLESKFGGAWS